MDGTYRFDKPVVLSCPECGGTLRCRRDNGLLQYRCHIGHVLTGETLLDAQRQALEYKLCGALALLIERGDLCDQIMAADRGAGGRETQLKAIRDESLARAEIVRNLLEDGWALAPDLPD